MSRSPSQQRGVLCLIIIAFHLSFSVSALNVPLQPIAQNTLAAEAAPLPTAPHVTVTRKSTLEPPTLATTAFYHDRRGILAPRATPTIESISGYTYLGCYQEAAGILSETSSWDMGMTPNLCRNICVLASASLFGLDDNWDCFCGSNLAEYAIRGPDSDCTEPCRGNSLVVCGGTSRLNIYSATEALWIQSVVGSANSPATATTTGSAGSTTSGSSSDDSSTNSGDGGSGSGSGDSSRSRKGVSLPLGATVGIALGAAAAALIFAGISFYMCCYRRSQPNQPAAGYVDPPIPPPPPANNMTYYPPPPASTTTSDNGKRYEPVSSVDGTFNQRPEMDNRQLHEMPVDRRYG